MNVYHVANPDSTGSILANGLERTSRGDKGDDKKIIKTDMFLDAKCPSELKNKGLSRDDNIYAYVVTDGMVMDITDGTPVPSDKFIEKNNRTLELEVDEKRCFVSDLDTYDSLMSAFASDANESTLNTLAKSYWDKVTPLEKYINGQFRRPEIMITYDLAPNAIRLL